MTDQVSSSPHISVLLDEVLSSLMPIDGKVIVDGTFGAGGYSRAFLKANAKHVYGIDRDPHAKHYASELAGEYSNFTFLEGRFSDIKTLLLKQNVQKVDAFVLDIGISSMQIDQAERGFSFMHDGPLDMRMGREGESAADIINSYEEVEIANILYRLGEERRSRHIAREIVHSRKLQPITTTKQLSDLISKIIPKSPKDKKHPATRSFQALRLAVNQELDELEKALEASIDILKPGAILAVVSFHSLEDRIVKKFMNMHSGKTRGISRHLPIQEAVKIQNFILPRGYPKAPSDEEVRLNPRSRSSKLRVGIRIDSENAN